MWITPGAAPLRWMGPNRNPRWEQKRTAGYVIVSRLLALQKRLATPLICMYHATSVYISQVQIKESCSVEVHREYVYIFFIRTSNYTWHEESMYYWIPQGSSGLIFPVSKIQFKTNENPTYITKILMRQDSHIKTNWFFLVIKLLFSYGKYQNNNRLSERSFCYCFAEIVSE